MNQTIKVFTDGGARGNPGPAAAGIAVFGIAGKERLLCGKYLGVATNNVAEYTAFLLAFATLIAELKSEVNQVDLEFYADSMLAVRQLRGEFRVKNPNLVGYVAKIKDQEKLFHKVTYQHIPREENKLADFEVNKALDQEMGRPAKKGNFDLV